MLPLLNDDSPLNKKTGLMNVHALQELMSSQTLAYKFPFSQFSFPTDNSCIILSEGRKSAFFKASIGLLTDYDPTKQIAFSYRLISSFLWTRKTKVWARRTSTNLQRTSRCLRRTRWMHSATLSWVLNMVKCKLAQPLRKWVMHCDISPTVTNIRSVYSTFNKTS